MFDTLQFATIKHQEYEFYTRTVLALATITQNSATEKECLTDSCSTIDQNPEQIHKA